MPEMTDPTKRDQPKAAGELDILSRLFGAREAAWCTIVLIDGRSFDGELIFNDFSGECRLNNVRRGQRVEFPASMVMSVNIEQPPGSDPRVRRTSLRTG